MRKEGFMTERKLDWILGAFVFVFSLIIYLLTMAPTVSLWDCGEFIAVAYKMAVPHPPGAPYYLLLGRVFSLIPIFENIAARINLISVLSSAATIFFLYNTIIYFGKKIISDSRSFFEKTGLYTGGVVGALTFAFTHSFWFNAVEAEVYAVSMMFTALVVYLILRWEARADTPGHERYLLMIFYIIGLAIGVHLLNVLTLPFIFLIYFYRKYKLSWKNLLFFGIIGGAIFLVIYKGIIFGLPYIAKHRGFGAMIALIALVPIFFLIFYRAKQIISFVMLAIFLVLIGYSTYTTVYMRSNLNPNIDENNPETIEKFVSYLNREQYGTHTLDRKDALANSKNKKEYSGVSEFFWDYQLKHMYGRYFMWQFTGMDDNEVDFEYLRFWGIPLLLGLLGLFYQLSRDKRNTFAVFTLFFMTGLAIIFYLNQPDPQPRERDYSYVGSFFAFSVWIGIGAMAVFNFLKELKMDKNKVVGFTMAALLILISPIQIIAKEYHRHSRANNYLAWNYAYNLLNSVEENAVLITQGDNDTFPLWYLQEVEGIRTDVKVVNLSLINTSWYIYQLKHIEPKLKINLSDSQIENIERLVFSNPWKTKTVRITVPKELQEAEYELKKKQLPYIPAKLDTSGYIEFKLKPHFKIQGIDFLRVQDFAIHRIIIDNQWERPIYYSITCAPSSMLDGLRDYFRLDGMAYKLTTQKNWNLDPEKVKNKLTKVYKLEGLNDRSIYYRIDDQKSLMTNYRSLFFQLNDHYIHMGEMEKGKEIIDLLHKTIDTEHMPYNSFQVRLLDYLNSVGSGSWPADSLMTIMKNQQYMAATVSYISNTLYKSPYYDKVYLMALEKSNSDMEYNFIVENYMKYLIKRGEREKAADYLSKETINKPGNRTLKNIAKKFKL